MAARYYVWGAGSWRELDVAAGCVAGWRRRARFVFVRRGRLQVAGRRAVLRALAALAAGRPGAAADGPRLSQLRTSPVSGSKLRPRERRGLVPHCHCSAHHNGCVEPPLPAAPGRREAATQCATERSLNINMPPAPARPAPAPAPPSSSEEPSPPPPRRTLRNTMSEVNALLAPAPPAPRTAPPPPPVTDPSSSDERPLARYASGAVNAGSSGGAVKELVISDGDVAALRGFVARSRPSALARFDADAAYKCALFYAINPLVELRRCARLERLLRERRDAALPHFAARLGLAPASPAASSAASPGPARRRRDHSDSTDADKENKEQLPSPKKARTERSSKNEASSPAKQTARPSRAPPPRAPLGSPPARTTKTEASASSKRVPRPLPPRSPPADDARVTRSSTGATHSPDKPVRAAGDVITQPKLNGAKHSPSKAARGAGDVTAAPKLNGAASSESDEWRAGSKAHTHVISKRSCGSKRAEYSNLEDHAIVSWVSVGARASLVNGNALWRDLQAQFPRLGGRARTWHSLRNRYLRYILPALAALRLPPAHESRLRAAAATGVTKTKGKRRNSIFKEAERGASSVRPRPPPSPPSPAAAAAASPSKAQAAPAAVTTIKKEVQTESRTLRRSPRYSEVTRQFAARHAPRAASSTDSSSDSSPAPSPTRSGTTNSPRGGRSRRLFNPNRNV